MNNWVYPFYKISDEISRPWIPIQIINPKNNKSINMLALLDTGADHCVFPQVVTTQTGLDIKKDAVKSEIMQGLAEAHIDIWIHTFRINLLATDWRTVLWKSMDLSIGCVSHSKIPPILGFSNFMCNFKISFNHATKRIIINDQPKI
jgi:hypothetical protein